MGLGAFPAPHRQWLGMLGMHGTRAANYAMDEADLIVAIGARFDDRITGKLSEFAPRAKFVHIDIDPAEISKNVPAHIPIVGDAKRILGRLVEPSTGRSTPTRRAWPGGGSASRAGAPSTRCATTTRPTPRSSRSSSSRRSTRRRTAASASCPPTSASTRCGPRSTSTSRSPRRWINSGGLGTMGFGLPAAIGAAIAVPDLPSVLLTGDGSIQMNIQELAHRAPVRRAGQVRDHGQRLPRHGPPVAGAVLGPALLERRHGPVAGLGQARRGLRLHRRAARPTRRRWSTTSAPPWPPRARSSST